MVELKNKQIIIDGKPVLILSGEIHYYRLSVDEWEDRINKLVEAGCNTVASYVPWLCHEEIEGEIDLEGKNRPELNLARFIDLCKEKGLYFFLRPGPFIMAEMKNEGIPYWVLEKHPEIIPTTWDGKVTPAKTLDYLAPNFLKEVDKWYKAVMSIIKPRLYQNGGNVIAIQLDNEIGMLSWVSNSPDLTDNVLLDFCNWLKEKYQDELIYRYPFTLDDFNIFRNKVISPEEEYATNLMRDLGYYNRYRFKKYVLTLKEIAEKYGVKDVPFVVNIHGCSRGRGKTFPIGISQLYEAFNLDGIISGSDIYFGDLNIPIIEDLYLVNSFITAMTNNIQPIGSVEFNCGDGNFGDNLGSRTDVSASDFKARMCIAQGNRLINYYLFAGGRNYRLKQQVNDGNDRIAITGERHGYAAPVNPEGKLSYTYHRLKYCNKVIRANESKLATMHEEYDNIAFGLIIDYYMTESYYPNSAKMKSIINNLQANRASAAWDIYSKLLLLLNYRFKAIDLQNNTINEGIKVLLIPSALYMEKAIQQKLVNHLNKGGSILLCGEIPIYDMEGNPCTILANALGVTVKETIYNKNHHYLSVYPVNFASNSAEIRTHYAQIYESDSITPIYRVYESDAICAFEANVHDGKAIVYGCDLKADFDLVKLTLSRLGAQNAIKHTNEYHGIFITTTINDADERFIHIFNLDGFRKETIIYLNNEPLFGGKNLVLDAKEAVMLPLNVCYNGITILYATAEVVDVGINSLEFRLTQPEDIILLKTDKEVIPNDDINITKSGKEYLITSRKHAYINNSLTIFFK